MTEGDERPAFQELLVALLSNGTRTVLIERLDRIARDIIIQESILKDLIQRGFELISAAEPDLCSSDPYRSAMRQMLGVFAELDRKGERKRNRKRNVTEVHLDLSEISAENIRRLDRRIRGDCMELIRRL